MRKVFAFIFLSLPILLAYQNCAENVAFETSPVGSTADGGNMGNGDGINDDSNSDGDGVSDNDGGNNDGGPGDQDDIDYVKTTCENSPWQSLNTSITFPSYQNGCAYNQNGNLGPRNGFVQARYEHIVPMNIPDNAIICDLDMQTQTSTMYYDDHLIVALNNYVLSSSNLNYIEDGLLVPVLNSDTQETLYKYDWAQMVGAPWRQGGNHNVVYCLGEDSGNSSCQIPLTQNTGSFKVDIDEDALQTIIGLSNVGSNHKFKLVVTGDNDLDCISSEFSFNVNIKYVIADD
tara:strand:+ start:7527 stop:8393 length:867 start_codon:yes stop_codon:yes gene_type:complete